MCAVHEPSLSAVSRARLAGGHALRILDSKDSADQLINTSAPRLADYASPASVERYGVYCLVCVHLWSSCMVLCRFNAVLAGLTALKIEYEIDPFLVRGLDY